MISLESHNEKLEANDAIKANLSEINRHMGAICDRLYLEPGATAAMTKNFESVKEQLSSFAKALYERSQELSNEYKVLREAGFDE
jgi:hypothetical protein